MRRKPSGTKGRNEKREHVRFDAAVYLSGIERLEVTVQDSHCEHAGVGLIRADRLMEQQPEPKGSAQGDCPDHETRCDESTPKRAVFAPPFISRTRRRRQVRARPTKLRRDPRPPGHLIANSLRSAATSLSTLIKTGRASRLPCASEPSRIRNRRRQFLTRKLSQLGRSETSQAHAVHQSRRAR